MNFFDAHPDHYAAFLICCWLCPRLTIAVMSCAYWQTNPILVVLVFASALGGFNSFRVGVKRNYLKAKEEGVL